MQLYQIANALAKLEDMTEEDSSLVEYLESVQMELKDKVNNIIKFERNLEVNAEAIDHEIKRLQDLKKSYSNKAEALKNYISVSMQRNGIEKIETDIAKLSFRKSESVEITDEKLIPKEFMVEKVTFTPDKTAIKSAIKQGRIVDGVVLKENQNLQIK